MHGSANYSAITGRYFDEYHLKHPSVDGYADCADRFIFVILD